MRRYEATGRALQGLANPKASWSKKMVFQEALHTAGHVATCGPDGSHESHTAS